ncbi:unnamed protein product [Oncorhynchus mykiss]|uniref:Uncharacterized protein n=1 Tax=Oncorhynchus mykiss TaxID=8022 RepID=A0A060VU33_ONCMY|nr:unnamed protein product [Oncorhynchus mykiss]
MLSLFTDVSDSKMLHKNVMLGQWPAHMGLDLFYHFNALPTSVLSLMLFVLLLMSRYETTSSEEESSEEEKGEVEEEEVDSSEPEEEREKEEGAGAAQGQGEATATEDEAQGAGAQAGETEGHEDSQDPENSQALLEEQPAAASGETIDKGFMEACDYIEGRMAEVVAPDKEMRHVLMVLYQEWFRVSSQKDSLADTVTLYLREVGIATPTLLRYIVNLADGNGNTALHYSVSHSNFPVVKLLLDTGLCEVDILNKAGYTAVMLASLTAADGSEDMEVALQLLRQGDVNARASQVHKTLYTYTYTVEVGSLHTLRLESLKLVFQPLHKCLVNKL